MKSKEQRLTWALEVCRQAQMRPTLLREEILAFLAGQRTPVSLDRIAGAPGISGHCDHTTVYRTLMLFKAADIVRPVGTPDKISYFILNVPGECNHFLICRRCGCITELPLPEGMAKRICQIAGAHGFLASHHDHEIHGLCAACEAARAKETVPCKFVA